MCAHVCVFSRSNAVMHENKNNNLRYRLIKCTSTLFFKISHMTMNMMHLRCLYTNFNDANFTYNTPTHQKYKWNKRQHQSYKMMNSWYFVNKCRQQVEEKYIEEKRNRNLQNISWCIKILYNTEHKYTST